MVVAVVIVDHVVVAIADHVQIIVVMTTVHATTHLAKSVHHVMNHKVVAAVISSSIDQQLTFIRVVMVTSPPFLVCDMFHAHCSFAHACTSPCSRPFSTRWSALPSDASCEPR
jgi:hypothetical protein